MQFLTILVLLTAIAWLVGRRRNRWRDHARRGLAAAMIVAGITHFANVEPFVQHLPDWVPTRETVVYLTGVVEVALGLALLLPTGHRTTTGRLVATYLVAVLPANVYVAVADIDVTGLPGGVHAWIRLPLQLLFIAWAVISTTPNRNSPPTSSLQHPSRPMHQVTS